MSAPQAEGARPRIRGARNWLNQRPLLFVTFSVIAFMALALVGVRAVSVYVDHEQTPVTYLAQLQHTVDDEARIEVKVALEPRIQPSDLTSLTQDADQLAFYAGLLNATHGNDPVIKTALAKLNQYQTALQEEVNGCAGGLYDSCAQLSHTAVEPLHVQVLAAMEAALQSITNRAQLANFIGGLLASILVLLVGIGLLITIVVSWRRREGARRAEKLAVERSEARFRALLQNSFDAITVADARGVLLSCSDAVLRVFGKSGAELIGTNVLELINQEDFGPAKWEAALAEDTGVAQRVYECRVRHGQSWRWIGMAVSNLLDHPDIGGVVLNIRDITERKSLENQLAHQALHDPLTSLGNRVLFRSALESLMRRQMTSGPIAVLFIDLDDFKEVNDALGHVAGDELLVDVAAALQSACRAGDLAVRMGGDEFAVLLQDADPATAMGVANRLLQLLDRPFLIAGKEVTVSASVGVACLDQDEIDSETLLRRADLAMYAAKSSGKGHIELYETGLEETAVRRLDMLNELRRAIERRALTLQYQPLVTLKTGALCAVEALARWEHKSLGSVPPLEFVTMAEQTGLIVPMGKLILEMACAQLAQWCKELPDQPFSLSVNMSYRQLREPDLISTMLATCEQFGVDPERIIVEITESMLVEDLPTIYDRLGKLRACGIKIAIDDFGSGYSSLSYLRKLPFDIVKIDRSFVEHLDGSGEARSLTKAIVRLLTGLGVAIVAEGIETEEQLAFLATLGVDIGQGFLFARPLDSDAVTAFATTGRPAPVAPSLRRTPSAP